MIGDMVDREVTRIAGGDNKKELEKKELPKMKHIDGFVKDAKTSPFKTFKKLFIEEDLPTVKENVIKHIIVPRLKEIFYEAIAGAAARTFLGKDGLPSVGSSRLANSLVRNVSTQITDYSTSLKKIAEGSSSAADKFTFEDIVMQDRAAAQDLVDQLKDWIDRYTFVTVGQVYDAVGVPDAGSWTENNYGWRKGELDNIQFVRVTSGWWVKLPKPHQL